MKVKKLLFLGLIIFISIFANVILHEMGHFAIADYMGLEPEMHLESPVNISEGYVVTTPNFAYVSYNNMFPKTSIQDMLVATGGPIVNAIMALVATMLFIIPQRRVTKYALLIFIIVSVMSFSINMIPIEPSDGSIIFTYFMNL